MEVISAGSERTDRTIKHLEYADAGIPHYWVVDLGEAGDRVSLTAHHLASEFGPVTWNSGDGGEFATTEPFRVRIDLDALV